MTPVAKQPWFGGALGAVAPTPSHARVHGFLLGGRHYYGPDRELAEQLTAACPSLPALVRSHRRFTLDAVAAMVADAGLRQVLDLGAGLPLPPSVSPAVHEIARTEARRNSRSDGAVVDLADARPVSVAYVDPDPTVVAWLRATYSGLSSLWSATGDARDLPALLRRGEARRVVDLTAPVGVVLTGCLHRMSAPQARELLAGLRRALAPGSRVALAVPVREGSDTYTLDRLAAVCRSAEQNRRVAAEPAAVRAVRAITDYGTAPQLLLHSRAEIDTWLTGWRVTSPGLVDVTAWHGTGSPFPLRLLVGIAERPPPGQDRSDGAEVRPLGAGDDGTLIDSTDNRTKY